MLSRSKTELLRFVGVPASRADMGKGGRPSFCSGFSLLELVTALALFSLGVMGAIQTYQFGLSKIRVLQETAVAMTAIQNEIETLRAMPFAALSDRDGAPFVSQTPEVETLVHAASSLTIRPVGDPALRLKEVTARLRWTGDNGRTITKSIATWIGDRQGGGA